MKVEIIIADITTLTVDAIVNAANGSLTGGGGVDGAIHRAAGPALKEFCFTLRGCKTGFAKITPGFNLPAKYIIHTVGPVWNNGTANEESLLKSCYESSLQLAVENNIKTIAFPCISTGAYRFPFAKAAAIALQTVNEFLKENNSIDKIFLVVYSQKEFEHYQNVLNNMQLTTLYRPVGQKELDLIKTSGFKAFPPRLDWQPIFYPVLNQPYAAQIALEWNTKDAFSGYAGYVTAFDLPTAYLQKFEVQNVGGEIHNELWVPAEELDEFNNNIVGTIKVVEAFYGENFKK